MLTMAASSDAYEVWLTDKLLSLNPETDTDVFVSYITGILDEDAPDDEKKESLVDFVGQVVEDNQEGVCDELMKKWEEMNGSSSQQQPDHAGELTDHLAQILEHQKIESVKPRKQSEEERARKRAILAQYNEVESGEEDEGGTHHVDSGDQASDLLGFKNDNTDMVKKQEQEFREKSKQESEKKREKDKQDRDAQKQKQKDRKETEKKRTQKQEKRR